MAAKNVHEALLDVQKALPSLSKDARNPHFKNKYVTLEQLMEKVLPVLHERDLLLLQLPTTYTGDLALETQIVHVPSGTEVKSVMPLNKLQKDDPQGQGSALTYARRYSLMATLGLVADEDDDGNAAAGRSSGPTDAALKRKAQALGAKLTGKEKPTQAEVAKALGVKAGDLTDRAVLERVLKEHGETA